jgi:AcrR family transcriptional regulator
MAGKPQFDFLDVLDRAAEVFRTSGYAGTSVDDLVAATGLSRSSIYHHFGDKDGLFEATLARYRQAGRERTAPPAEPADPRQATADLLAAVVGGLTGKSGAPRCLLVTGCAELATLPEPAAASVRAGIAEQQAQFATLVKAGIAAGQLPTGTDAAGLARHLTAVRQGMVVMASAGATRKQLEAMATQAMAAWDQPQTR